MRRNAEVKFARSTEEALKVLTFYPADVIISDTTNGFHLLDEIRSNPQTRYIPFVFFSISDHVDNQHKALMQGCDEFISKSSSVTYLKFRILRILERALALRQAVSSSIRTEPLKVFICYAKEDAASASRLFELLIQNGVNAWLDEEKLKAGQEWESEIRGNLRTSHAESTRL